MKKIRMTLSALLLLMLLGGCTSSTDMTTATEPPSASATPNITTVLPGATDGTDGVLPNATVIPESTGVTSMDKARRVIEQIEEELERLSEVEDAEVVIAGNKAAVGLEFDNQYKAGLDDRLRKIVKERIDGVISGISTIAITTDEGVMAAIESLGERLDTMSDMAALQSDLEAIIKKINGMNA